MIMKLPNGYGSITKLTGKRRKPWMVRITGEKVYDEKKQDFVQPRIVLGYFSTRAEANKALVEFNDNPFQLQDNNITFLQIYEKYKKMNYDSLSKSSRQSREAALKYCEPIFSIPVKNINYNMLEQIINNCPYGSSTKKNIKTCMMTVFDYAMKNNLVARNPAESLNIEYSEPVIERTIFSDAEIKILWKNASEWDYQIILMLLYSGMRVNELLKNYRENVNLEERWIYIPKELAKNNESVRYVPIHDKTYDFFKAFYENSEKYQKTQLIINPRGTLVAYNNFVTRNLVRINKNLNCTHRFHDTRHTFATLGNRFGIEELFLQKIMGHKPASILRNTYTHITNEELLKKLNQINI